MPATKTCETCGVVIIRKRHTDTAKWKKKRWCSKECRYPKEKFYKVCAFCGYDYPVTRGRPGSLAYEESKYCNWACTQGARNASSSSAEDVQEALFLLEGGVWPPHIAERLGTTVVALHTAMKRAGNPKAARFDPRQYEEGVTSNSVRLTSPATELRSVGEAAA